MEQLRKIGLWCWEYKERFVLTIMVLILGYRVYFLVYSPADEHKGERFQHPDDRRQKSLDLPPRPPDSQDLIPLTPLMRAPVFVYTPPGKRGSSSDASEDPGQDKLKLVRILEVGKDTYKAQIFTGASRKVFAVGDAFESYTVMRIDADEECVELYSENTSRSFELCIE